MKKYLFVFVALFLNQALYSQVDQESDEEIDDIIDAVIGMDDDDLLAIVNSLNSYHILFASVDFNDKTYFLGRDLGIDQYNITSQVSYESSIGIFGGISGTYYSKLDPKWDVTVLTAGYGIALDKNENLRTELSYSRYIFSDSDSNAFSNSITGSVHAATNNGSFGSALNAAYLFGKKTGFQASISIYGDIKLFDLNALSGTSVNFGPDLTFFLGKENIDTSRIDNLGIDSPFINRIVDSFETFDLRNIQLQLPVIFELNNLNIEVGYNLNFPKAFEFENNADTSSFINVGLSYIFNLK